VDALRWFAKAKYCEDVVRPNTAFLPVLYMEIDAAGPPITLSDFQTQ